MSKTLVAEVSCGKTSEPPLASHGE